MTTITFEENMAHLRPEAPTLVSLLTAMHDQPTVAQLDDWVYCRSGSYTVLGTLLSEMHPAYDGLEIPVLTKAFDGHNALEEFVIRVFDAIANYHQATDGHTYDMDKIAHELTRDILCERSPDLYECRDEPETDDTGGGRY
jgi:hypothetical protein